MSKKYPILWDFVYGITATYTGFKEDPSKESDLVTPIYTPLSSFFSKPYPVSIPNTSIIPIEIPISRVPGAFSNIVIILEDSKGNAVVLEKLKGVIDKTLAGMRERLEAQKIELMTSKHRASEKTQESRKQIQEDSQLTRQKQPNPFGFGDSRFGDDFENRRFGRNFDEVY